MVVCSRSPSRSFNQEFSIVADRILVTMEIHIHTLYPMKKKRPKTTERLCFILTVKLFAAVDSGRPKEGAYSGVCVIRQYSAFDNAAVCVLAKFSRAEFVRLCN